LFSVTSSRGKLIELLVPFLEHLRQGLKPLRLFGDFHILGTELSVESFDGSLVNDIFAASSR
jgi:hypothetical protein